MITISHTGSALSFDHATSGPSSADPHPVRRSQSARAAALSTHTLRSGRTYTSTPSPKRKHADDALAPRKRARSTAIPSLRTGMTLPALPNEILHAMVAFLPGEARSNLRHVFGLRNVAMDPTSWCEFGEAIDGLMSDSLLDNLRAARTICSLAPMGPVPALVQDGSFAKHHVFTVWNTMVARTLEPIPNVPPQEITREARSYPGAAQKIAQQVLPHLTASLMETEVASLYSECLRAATNRDGNVNVQGRREAVKGLCVLAQANRLGTEEVAEVLSAWEAIACQTSLRGDALDADDRADLRATHRDLLSLLDYLPVAEHAKSPAVKALIDKAVTALARSASRDKLVALLTEGEFTAPRLLQSLRVPEVVEEERFKEIVKAVCDFLGKRGNDAGLNDAELARFQTRNQDACQLLATWAPSLRGEQIARAIRSLSPGRFYDPPTLGATAIEGLLALEASGPSFGAWESVLRAHMYGMAGTLTLDTNDSMPFARLCELLDKCRAALGDLVDSYLEGLWMHAPDAIRQTRLVVAQRNGIPEDTPAALAHALTPNAMHTFNSTNWLLLTYLEPKMSAEDVQHVLRTILDHITPFAASQETVIANQRDRHLVPMLARLAPRLDTEAFRSLYSGADDTTKLLLTAFAPAHIDASFYSAAEREHIDGITFEDKPWFLTKDYRDALALCYERALLS